MIRKKAGKLMREIRKKNNINMVDLAKAINISQPRLSRIEKGEQEISLDVLEDFCGYFNVSLTFFMRELERQGIESDLSDREIEGKFTTLTEEQRRAINLIIVAFLNKNSIF
ncbi:helix-turn-helix domain-containing protein [Planococcus sp. NCCP-2050]|uniref:helix-turn-helix domain-containing protein n=1 Tax=Planococcus sp. NCCP-2050 TaxID=2944679 RepID=UPI002040F37E|nr:helix-turn-helix transcriptional regulator [Planococcus sp. NCCP-2050]GKW47006.1 hypothetical protein NCCP2050_26980 [Planococcus sp. NCCP-2050]